MKTKHLYSKEEISIGDKVLLISHIPIDHWIKFKNNKNIIQLTKSKRFVFTVCFINDHNDCINIENKEFGILQGWNISRFEKVLSLDEDLICRNKK